MTTSELSEAIRELRKALGNLSQERFARRVGTTVRTVARWEAAETLSARILSRLRSIAVAANAFAVADIFEAKLREGLAWEPEDNLDPVAPATPKEYGLVREFLARVRAEDPGVQPMVEQLEVWIGETEKRIAEYTLSRLDQRLRAHKARPDFRSKEKKGKGK